MTSKILEYSLDVGAGDDAPKYWKNPVIINKANVAVKAKKKGKGC